MALPAFSTDALARFAADGAIRVCGAAGAELPCLHAALVHLPRDRPGVRIADQPSLFALLGPGSTIGQIASEVLGREAHAVRAILFDKTPGANWGLGWHQDRTICVTERVETACFGPWTVKDGLCHVEPPFSLLSRMTTLRIHLDRVLGDNAPLLIAPGSHLLGRIAANDVDPVVRRLGVVTCLAEAGDVWVYATPILHASRAAERPERRRVLQVDFAAEALPAKLEWLGL